MVYYLIHDGCNKVTHSDIPYDPQRHPDIIYVVHSSKVQQLNSVANKNRYVFFMIDHEYSTTDSSNEGLVIAVMCDADNESKAEKIFLQCHQVQEWIRDNEIDPLTATLNDLDVYDAYNYVLVML